MMLAQSCCGHKGGRLPLMSWRLTTRIFLTSLLLCLPLSLDAQLIVSRNADDVIDVDTNGFPKYYQDASGTQLTICPPTDQKCPIVGDLQDPSQPYDPVTNRPDEAFYFALDCKYADDVQFPAGKAIFVYSLEAGFASPDGLPQAGQEIVFSRVRIRLFGVTPNEYYDFDTPAGKYHLKAEDSGNVLFTADVGTCARGFTQAERGDVGPTFIKGASFQDDANYIGDGVTEEAFVNSKGVNSFTISGPGLPAAGLSTTTCVVQGKIYNPDAPAPVPTPAAEDILTTTSVKCSVNSKGVAQWRVGGTTSVTDVHDVTAVVKNVAETTTFVSGTVKSTALMVGAAPPATWDLRVNAGSTCPPRRSTVVVTAFSATGALQSNTLVTA